MDLKDQEFQQSIAIEEHDIHTTYTEEHALKLIKEKWLFDEQEERLLVSVYELLKTHIPSTIKNSVTIRYSKYDKDNLACNLQNYRLFLLPKSNKKFVEFILPAHSIQILSNILTSERMATLNIWSYKAFDAILVDLTMEEILNLKEEHWNAYETACTMALLAKKSRSREGNVEIEW